MSPHARYHSDGNLRVLVITHGELLATTKTSFLFGRKEEERVTSKISKQAESPACTKNRTRLRTSSQFHDL